MPGPLAPQIYKTFNTHHRKKNETYGEFYFSMGNILVIFSFFRTDNDLVCAPHPLSGMSLFFRNNNYSHTFAHNSKITRTMFLKLWEVVLNNER